MRKIFLDGLQPALERRRRAGRGKRPATTVLQADGRTFQQGAYPACQPAVLGDNANRLPPGKQPLTYLKIDGLCFLFGGVGRQDGQLAREWRLRNLTAEFAGTLRGWFCAAAEDGLQALRCRIACPGCGRVGVDSLQQCLYRVWRVPGGQRGGGAQNEFGPVAGQQVGYPLYLGAGERRKSNQKKCRLVAAVGAGSGKPLQVGPAGIEQVLHVQLLVPGLPQPVHNGCFHAEWFR